MHRGPSTSVWFVLVTGCFADAPPLGAEESGSSGPSADTTASASTSGSASTSAGETGTSTSTSVGETSTTEAGSEESAQDSTADGGDPCGDEGMCAPPVPKGWSGPIVVATSGGAPATCPMAWPEPALVAHRDLQWDPAQCGCDCGAPSTGCTTMIGTTNTAGCAAVIGGIEALDADECAPLSTSGFIQFTPSAGGLGSCPSMVTTALPEPTWQTTLAGCASPPQAPRCGEGVCVLPIPAPFESRLCITAPGAIDCPGGPYSEAQVYAQDVADERICGPCTCGGVIDQQCDMGSSFELYDDIACAQLLLTSDDGTCVDAPAGTTAVRYVPANPGHCAVQEPSVPGGIVLPIGDVTICCTP